MFAVGTHAENEEYEEAAPSPSSAFMSSTVSIRRTSGEDRGRDRGGGGTTFSPPTTAMTSSPSAGTTWNGSSGLLPADGDAQRPISIDPLYGRHLRSGPFPASPSVYRHTAPPSVLTFLSDSSHLSALVLLLTYNDKCTRGFSEAVLTCEKNYDMWHRRHKSNPLDALERYKPGYLSRRYDSHAPVAFPLSKFLIYPGSETTGMDLLHALGYPRKLRAAYHQLLTGLMEEDQLNLRCETKFLDKTPLGSLSAVIHSTKAVSRLVDPAPVASPVPHDADMVLSRFIGTYQLERSCGRCHATDRSTDPFLTIDLRLPSSPSSSSSPHLVATEGNRSPYRTAASADGDVQLEDLLSRWVGGQHQLIERSHCDVCGSPSVTIFEARTVIRWPKVLAIHFDRFQDLSDKQSVKCDTAVRFPVELELPSCAIVCSGPSTIKAASGTAFTPLLHSETMHRSGITCVPLTGSRRCCCPTTSAVRPAAATTHSDRWRCCSTASHQVEATAL